MYTCPAARRASIEHASTVYNPTSESQDLIWGIVDPDDTAFAVHRCTIQPGEVVQVEMPKLVCNTGDRMVLWANPGIHVETTVVEFDAHPGLPKRFGGVATDEVPFHWTPARRTVVITESPLLVMATDIHMECQVWVNQEQTVHRGTDVKTLTLPAYLGSQDNLRVSTETLMGSPISECTVYFRGREISQPNE